MRTKPGPSDCAAYRVMADALEAEQSGSGDALLRYQVGIPLRRSPPGGSHVDTAGEGTGVASLREAINTADVVIRGRRPEVAATAAFTTGGGGKSF